MLKQQDMKYEWQEISSFLIAAGVLTTFIATII